MKNRWLLVWAFAFALTSCTRHEERLLPRSLTWAELRTVRAGVRVTPPDENGRVPYGKERLSDGTKVEVASGGLAWLRRDAGATLLVRGPAALTLRSRSLVVREGRLFADTPPGTTTEIDTPGGKLALSDVRASIDVSKDGAVRAYVLSGEMRTEKGRARAGEELSILSGGAVRVRAVRAWEDWTGGLATTDRNAAPSPFGVGTVGARAAGAQGSPRFPLSIQRMDVRVTFDGDFAVTEVDQTFFNPTSETVEGLYGFRTPERAILQRFGVDRDGVVVWGRVKEKAAAAAEYRANVYQGSTEDPALLEWDAPGVYRARLYPIGPGAIRRVVIRYAEWLDRTGDHAERRLYVYPMAAEGSEESLPHVEELKVTFELGKAAAKEVRVGMAGVRRGDELVVREHDFVPRADLALELVDDGGSKAMAYTAPHFVDFEALSPSERGDASRKAKEQADYVLVPIRPEAAKLPEGGLDLAIVIDASAATEKATLAIARAATSALLAQLGERDRAVVLAGDAGLRPVVPELAKLSTVDAVMRAKVEDALADVALGGSTDLGAMISDAARELDPARRSAVVYIGDATPTVGELSLASLGERLDKLPHRVRIFGLGIGDSARLDLLSGLARGAFAERVSDGSQAARAALRVLEEAERPVWLGTKVDLGPGVERVFPREASALVSGETLWVLGRLSSGERPSSVKVTSPAGTRELSIQATRVEDGGDLGRRWAEARLGQMLEDGEGRAALVDLGMKSGIITPVTSFYVPTASQMTDEERAELATRREKRKALSKGSVEDKSEAAPLASAAPAGAPAPTTASVDNKEGGTGTRALAEEKPLEATEKDSPASQRHQALKDAVEFGMIGAAKREDNEPKAPSAPAARKPSAASEGVSAPSSDLWGDEIGGALGAGAALSGAGVGGGGLAAIGDLGRDGFGAGHGRLGGAHKTSALKVRMGASTVSGRLPPEVIQRIVRQNFGRFRMCYERGLVENPKLGGGEVRARFVIRRDGSVSNVGDGGSSLSNSKVVDCVLTAFRGLAFPEPEGGIVTVVLPVTFEAPAGSEKPRGAAVAVTLIVGDLPRKLFGCSDAAAVPLEARVSLWRERLASVAGNEALLVNNYRRALADCEADSFRERSRLLSLMLDAMPGVRGKVELYRTLMRDLGAADVLYRGILARIRTPEEMRELHTALGLVNVDPGILEKLVRETPDPKARAARLRALAAQFPDDFNLALAILDALEDSGDVGAVRDAARRLRERADADASVRTALGELYTRLAVRATDQKAELVAEARRAFGEIVEFAPEDPVARRRLGDLLLAHGFFADAERQYATLATLTPDDAKVFLLLAAAAEGRGLLEQALKWTERGGASGAPDSDSGAAATARALAATYLAWGRAEARSAGRTEELEALTARAARVLAAGRADPDRPLGVRVSLSWSHPELHPTLWTNALGTVMPAPDGDVTLGILQALVPERDSSFVEVRLEPADLEHAARLGATAELTLVFDELGKAEKIVKLRVEFERGGPTVQRFSLAGKEARRG